jgi:cell division septal protein FtsQ
MARRRTTRQRSTSRLGKDAPQRAPGPLDNTLAALRRVNWSKVAAFLLFLASVWFLYSLFMNPRFRVRHIEIEGATLVQDEMIEQVTGVTHQSIFRVNPTLVRQQLEDTFGCIAGVSVLCRLPNHVLVQVEEHDDLLIWSSGGHYWWVDEQGRVLGETPSTGELPVVEDYDGVALAPEDYVIGVPWGYALQLASVASDYRHYGYTRETGLIIRLPDNGWPVYMGYDGDAQTKIGIMTAVAAELRQMGGDVEYIDLRGARRPTYKRR